MSSEEEFNQSQTGKQKFYPLVPVVLKPESDTSDSATEHFENDTSDEGQSTQSPEAMFSVSPALVSSHTASIVIDELPESKNLSHVLETGEILTTGAIDISMLTANTGEISILDAERADASLAVDSTYSNIATIAPIRATQVTSFGSEYGILPKKLRRGEGQLYVALTVSIALVATGALVLAGYMLDLFN